MQATTLDIKAVIKWILSGEINEKLNKKSDANDERFNIHMTFENLHDDYL